MPVINLSKCKLLFTLTLCSFFFLFSSYKSTDTFEFVTVKNSSVLMQEIAKQFDVLIKPIYGNQTKSLEKISNANDRECEMLLCNKKLVGVIVYKTSPADDYIEYGYDKTLEIKTLFVSNPRKNSGKGIGTKLLNRIREAAKNNPSFKTIVVSVSEEKPESLHFFRKKGLKIFRQVPELYKVGKTEYFLGEYVR